MRAKLLLTRPVFVPYVEQLLYVFPRLGCLRACPTAKCRGPSHQQLQLRLLILGLGRRRLDILRSDWGILTREPPATNQKVISRWKGNVQKGQWFWEFLRRFQQVWDLPNQNFYFFAGNFKAEAVLPEIRAQRVPGGNLHLVSEPASKHAGHLWPAL